MDYKLKYLKYKKKYLALKNSKLKGGKTKLIEKTYIDYSNIHGKGIFNTYNLKENEKIFIGIDKFLKYIPYVTNKGSMINHSYNPNCRLLKQDNKFWVISNQFIPKRTELTLNYKYTPWYIDGPWFYYS